MKKMLILTMVLAITSVASAGWYFTVDLSANSVNVGDTVNVAILAGDYGVGSFSGSDENLAKMTITGGDLSGLSINSGAFAETPTPAISANDNVLSIVAGAPTSPIASGTELFSFDATASAAGTMIIDATSGNWNGDDATVGPDGTYYAEYGMDASTPYAEVTVVPEPMTMALLGLGGLFLRRRK